LITVVSNSYRYYACWRGTPHGARAAHAAVCPMSAVPAADVETYAWALVTENLLDPGNLHAGLAAARAQHDEVAGQQQARIAILDQEIARQRARLQKIALQRLDADTGGELDQVLLTAAQEAERTIGALQQEQGRLAAERSPGLSPEQALALEDFAGEIRTGLAAATPLDMRRIYDLLQFRGVIRSDADGIRLGRKYRFACDWDSQLPLRASNHTVLTFCLLWGSSKTASQRIVKRYRRPNSVPFSASSRTCPCRCRCWQIVRQSSARACTMPARTSAAKLSKSCASAGLSPG